MPRRESLTSPTVDRIDRIVIHAGMPKTGSTAIQRVLGLNRPILAEQGFCFPTAATRGDAHHPLAWSATLQRVPRRDVPGLDQTLAALTDELVGGFRVGILSSEALFHVPPQDWDPIVDWAREIAGSVHVCVYVRSPAAYHEGWYRQRVKTSGYERTFGEHLAATGVIDTLSRLDGLSRIWGKLMVRPYLREAFPDEDVVLDFCRAIGLDASTLAPVPLQRLNPSLNAELTEFKLALNRSGVEHTPRLERALVSWTRERPPDDRSLFSPDEWAGFIARTAESHRALVTRYGLPSELDDREPVEYTTRPLDAKRFRELFDEFAERFPDLATEIGPAMLRDHDAGPTS